MSKDFYAEFNEVKPSDISKVKLTYRHLAASDEDLEQVFGAIAALDESEEGEVSSIGSLRKFLEKPDCFYIVGHVDGEIAGRAFGCVIEHPRGSRSLFIDEVDTLTEHRRKGIAKGLMIEIKQIARACNAEEVWVGTEVDNRSAMALYRRAQPSEDEQFVIFTYKVGKN